MRRGEADTLKNGRRCVAEKRRVRREQGCLCTYTRPCILDEDPRNTKRKSQQNVTSTLSIQRRLAKPLAEGMNTPCNMQSGAIKTRLATEGLNASSRPGP